MARPQPTPAPTLEYQSPRDARWIVRTEADRVTLLLEGAPAWWQLTRAAGGLLLSAAGAVGFLGLAAGVWRGGGRRWEEVGWPLMSAGVAGVFAFLLALELRRFHLFGPARPTYRLTSPRIAGEAGIEGAAWAASPFVGDLDVLRVDDVLAWPGRLLVTGRRELLLRLKLSHGPPFDVTWKGSLSDLERLVAELRVALRLDDVQGETWNAGGPAKGESLDDTPDLPG